MLNPLPQHLREYATIRNNLAIKLDRSGDTDTAITLVRRALMTDPFSDLYRVNLSAFLIWRGELDEAQELLEGVIKRDGENPNAWSCMATLKLLRGDLGSNIKCAQRAVQLDPQHGQKVFDLACAYLRAGDFESGWPVWERRHMIMPPYVPPAVPKWTGGKAKRMFLWTEQGVGDKIQFARYIPLILDRGVESIVFATDMETAPLLAGYASERVEIMVPDDQTDYSGITCQFSLMSAPTIFKTAADTVPKDPGLFAVGNTRGVLIADGMKIGVVWAGNAVHANDGARSMPFKEMLVLAGDRRNDLFSLQVGPRTVDIGANRANILISDLSGNLEGSWQSTPTIVANMDLIVTVDTAVAHLAGVMNVPCFLVLSRFNDWRWMWDRSDSPWYPSIRIFRQDKLHDWRGVMKKVQSAINDLHVERVAKIERARNAQPTSITTARVEAA